MVEIFFDAYVVEVQYANKSQGSDPIDYASSSCQWEARKSLSDDFFA